jgi:hypothetical protein
MYFFNLLIISLTLALVVKMVIVNGQTHNETVSFSGTNLRHNKHTELLTPEEVLVNRCKRVKQKIKLAKCERCILCAFGWGTVFCGVGLIALIAVLTIKDPDYEDCYAIPNWSPE